MNLIWLHRLGLFDAYYTVSLTGVRTDLMSGKGRPHR